MAEVISPRLGYKRLLPFLLRQFSLGKAHCYVISSPMERSMWQGTRASCQQSLKLASKQISSPAKPLLDQGPAGVILTAASWKTLSHNLPDRARTSQLNHSQFSTLRNCEIINVYCFKICFRIICYATMDSKQSDAWKHNSHLVTLKMRTTF